MTLKEKKDFCEKLLIRWKLCEDAGKLEIPDFRKDSFIAQIMDKKFKVFEIDINLSDYFILMVELCTDGNPGQSQILIKEVLKKAKDWRNPTAVDFANTFPDEFPIMEIPHINEHYHKIYLEQKVPHKFGSLNLMDTPDYWRIA